MEAVPMKIDSLFTSGLIAVSSVLFMLSATITVALRFYVRKTTKLGLGADDWTVLVALILCQACSINMWVFAGIVGVNYSKLPLLPTVNETFKLFFSLELGIVKISILLLYKRIFIIRPFRIVVYILIAAVTAWTIATTLVSINMTKPVSGAWTDFTATEAINYNDYSLATAGISMGLDIIILTLPLIMVNRLHLDIRRKIAVSCVFALGFIVCVASAVRFALLYESVYGVTSNTSLFGTLNKAFYFAGLEINISVVAASLPILRPLFIGEGKSGFFSWLSSGQSRVFSRSRSSKNQKLSDSEKSNVLVKSSSSGSQTDQSRGSDIERDAGLPGSEPWTNAQNQYTSSSFNTHPSDADAQANTQQGITVTRTMETRYQ